MIDLSQFATPLAELHDRTAYLFVRVEVPGDYVGNTYQWQPATPPSLDCGAQAVTDKQTIEIYGPRIEQMLVLHFSPGAAVSDGMGISFNANATEPEFKVVSCPPRKMYTYALVELIGIGNRS